MTWHLGLDLWHRTSLSTSLLRTILSEPEAGVRCAMFRAARPVREWLLLPEEGGDAYDYVRNCDLARGETPYGHVNLTAATTAVDPAGLEHHDEFLSSCVAVDCLMTAPVHVRTARHSVECVPAFRVVDRSADRPVYMPVLWISLSAGAGLHTSIRLCPPLGVAESPIAVTATAEGARRNLLMMRRVADTLALSFPNMESAPTLRLESVPSSGDDNERFRELLG